MSIFPYVYFMVESFRVTENDRKIALYAGLITSSFTFAEFTAGVFWGRMSDWIGRKPVLIMGLIGTAISMVVFGFSPNLPTAMTARALGGLLNGNIGVLQTTVAEIVTVKEHQPRAYSIMPFVWCLGSIIGPALGGTLAQPCDNYPGHFQRGTIFARFPFLLPNLVCVLILVLGIIIGLLFLEETHALKKDRYDPGLELGRWLLRWCCGSKGKYNKVPEMGSDREEEEEEQEDFSTFTDDPPPIYRSREGSPSPSLAKGPYSSYLPDDLERHFSRRKLGYGKVFTKQVIFNIVGYGILAYTSKSHEKAVFPFKISGGFALPTKTIGTMLAIQGFYSMVAQLLLFPAMVRVFGELRTLRFVLMIWPPLYFVVPYFILLPSSLQIPAVYAALFGKITLHVIAFPSCAILLANAAPSSTVLGSINGVAASIASLSRSFGPTVTGILHTKGLESGFSGLSWWACGVVSVIGAIESCWIEQVDPRWREAVEKGKTQRPTTTTATATTPGISQTRGPTFAGGGDEDPSTEEELL
ncbi:Major facilitator superfamily domain containing protein [Elaphomyces granulatus]